MYEPYKVIRAWKLPFTTGNTVKYIARAGRKGDMVEDLRKARWYLDAEIEHLAPSPKSVDAQAEHDSIDAYRMMDTALKRAHMRTEPGTEFAMKDEVRVLREIAEQGWVVIRAEHM